MPWYGPGSISGVIYAPRGSNTHTLNSSTVSVGQRFVVPRSGTIDRLLVGVRAVTGTPPAYNVGLVTPASPGLTTTPYGGSAVASVTFSAAGLYVVTLPTAATATAGNVVGIRVWPGGTAPDRSNNITIVRFGVSPPFLGASHTTSSNLTIFSTTTGELTGLGVVYSDGFIPWAPITHTGTTGRTSPGETGAKIVLQDTVTVRAVRVLVGQGTNNSNFTVRVYDSSDTVLASATYNWGTSVDSTASGSRAPVLLFPNPITFQAGQTYRVVVSTASTISSISVLTVHHFNIALVKDAIGPVADMWTETSRPNTSSAWTDLDDQVPMVDLLVDSWPGGGSGGLALVQSGYLA